ncbi:MAG: metallophosphoesterase [Methanobacteriaceae archaeon]|nr:metallophosphoesterase [Methanobacteriaceae archaeon]
MDFVKMRHMMLGPVSTIVLLVFNYFLIDIIFNYLNFPLNSNVLISIVLILALLNLVSTLIEFRTSYFITRLMMEISELWKWASLLYLIEIILIYLVELIMPMPLYIIYILFLLIPVFGVIGYYIAHHNFIKKYTLNLENKSKDQEKLVSIIHVSDLHIGSIRGESLLKNFVNDINKIFIEKQKDGIDVITIISGDIADGSCPIKLDTFLTLNNAMMPVIFTPGNHDYYQGIDDLKESLKNANVIILDNDNLNLKEYDLNIIGLRYSFGSQGEDEYKLPISSDENNVLIYHAPDYWKDFVSCGIDLMLSGHTHGGQFIPANLWVKIVYPYIKGLYNTVVKSDDKLRNGYLSVTTGIGTMGPPIRLGTRAEIVVLDINRL